MNDDLRLLHSALLDLAGVMNSPQPDAALIEKAGISLDRALFPLLVRIEKLGPIGVVELANLVGRDYSTVSRQVAKLEELGLVTRRPGLADRRVREAMASEKGRTMAKALDAARSELAAPLIEKWSPADFHTLATLLRRFADDVLGITKLMESPRRQSPSHDRGDPDG